MKILIDNGHGDNTPGKCSPDGRLREYAWSRECAKRLVAALKKKGYDAELITPEASDVKLQTRVSRVNNICKAVGARNCLLVSIHNNAGGGDGKWHDACGWSVFVSKNASENSKKLARMLTVEAMKRELMGNRSVPLQKYWTWSWTNKDIYILKNTACPAVLTENFFYTNKDNLRFIASDEGRTKIVEGHKRGIINYLKKL